MRLIDADALLKHMEECDCLTMDAVRRVLLVRNISVETWVDGLLSEHRILVRGFPAVDLDNLRPKGRWVNGKYGPSCSECSSDAAAGYDEEPWETPFCPNCGADMRGEWDG